MIKKFLKTLISLSLCLIFLIISTASCGVSEPYSEGEGELNILCTSFAPFDFARNIVGEAAKVTLLQDGGADLHNYTPTAATLEAISHADLFIYIGGVSDEAWIGDAIRASGNSDLVTLCLMDCVTPVHAELENDWSDHDEHSEHDGHEGEHGHSGHDHGADEHVWTSPRNAKLMVSAISAAICKIDPQNVEFYIQNAQSYSNKLEDLDSQLTELFSDKQSSTLIFADRFPFVYLMHDYHVPYKAAFSGCSTEINSSVSTQVNLINAVREHRTTAILIIEGGSKDLAQAVASETGCRILTLNSMQSVSRSDILAGADYVEIMQGNINVLREVYH